MPETSDAQQVVPAIEASGESQVAVSRSLQKVDREVVDTSHRAMRIIAAAETEADSIQTYLDSLPRINECIDFSKLQKIGSGGTHDVYQSAVDQRYVIKIDRSILAKVKESGSTTAKAETYIKERNEENEALYDRFGRNNCIKERVIRAKVYIPAPQGPAEIETVISVQEKSDIFTIKDAVDFGTGYKGKIGEDLHARISADLRFKAKMAEFLTRFKEYFEQTGKFIDLIGEKNVMFYKDEQDQWLYVIGSVTKGDSREKFEKAYEKFTKNPEILSEAEKNSLRNGAAVINLVNEAGTACGIGKVTETNVSDKEIEKIINMLS